MNIVGKLLSWVTGRGTDDWDTPIEASLRKLDALVQCTAVSVTDTLPGSASEGDVYVVGTTPTGAATGWENRLARWKADTSAWESIIPANGWVVAVAGVLKRYTGTAWVDLPTGSYIPATEKAAANGVASLGADGKVPWAQIPSNIRSYTPTTKAIPAYALTSVLPAPITIPAGFLRQGSQLNVRFLIDSGVSGASNQFQWFIDGVSESGGTFNTRQTTDLRMQATREEGGVLFSRAEFRYSNGYNFTSALVSLDPDVSHTIDIQISVASATTVTVREYEITISDAPIPGVVPGVSDDSTAPQGCVSELPSSIVAIESKVPLFSGIAKTVTSIILTSGQWNAWGILFRDDGISDFATYAGASLSFQNDSEDPEFRATKKNDAYGWLELIPPHRPINVPSGSTYTLYLVAKSTHTGANPAYVYGNLYARRVR